MDKNLGNIPTLFFAAWIVLMIVLGVYTYRAGVETKKRWHTFFTILPGGVFLGFMIVLVEDKADLLFMAPAVALITFLNLKISKFCERCGRTVMHYFPRAKFCQGCGAPIGK